MHDSDTRRTRQSLSEVKGRTSKSGNNVLMKFCVDCRASGPTWASIPFAVYVCIDCSGIHRGLGVHISFVKSVTLDAWKKEQLQIMKFGGNKMFLDFIQLNSPSLAMEKDISCKYRSQTAQIYKTKLKELAGMNLEEVKEILTQKKTIIASPQKTRGLGAKKSTFDFDQDEKEVPKEEEVEEEVEEEEEEVYDDRLGMGQGRVKVHVPKVIQSYKTTTTRTDRKDIVRKIAINAAKDIENLKTIAQTAALKIQSTFETKK